MGVRQQRPASNQDYACPTFWKKKLSQKIKTFVFVIITAQFVNKLDSVQTAYVIDKHYTTQSHATAYKLQTMLQHKNTKHNYYNS